VYMAPSVPRVGAFRRRCHVKWPKNGRKAGENERMLPRVGAAP